MSRRLRTIGGFTTPKHPKCGMCDACCTTLGVKEIDKPAHERCSHLVKSGGCGIYDTRPKVCRSYECLWLQGQMPGWARPDRCGLIFEEHPDETILIVREAIADSGAIDSADGKQLIGLYVPYVPMILVYRDRRRLVGPEDKVREIAKRIAPELELPEQP